MSKIVKYTYSVEPTILAVQAYMKPFLEKGIIPSDIKDYERLMVLNTGLAMFFYIQERGLNVTFPDKKEVTIKVSGFEVGTVKMWLKNRCEFGYTITPNEKMFNESHKQGIFNIVGCMIDNFESIVTRYAMLCDPNSVLKDLKQNMYTSEEYKEIVLV